jgi:hypothetical protein
MPPTDLKSKLSFIVSQLLLPFRKTLIVVSAAIGCVGLVGTIRKIIELDLNQKLRGLLNFYESNVREPVHWALAQTGFAFPRYTSDVLLIYILFGVACIRSLFSIYDSPQTRVIKGAWGWLSNLIFKIAPKRGNGAKWIVYQVLAIIIWPLIAFEYCFRFKYVWGRYMDNTHRPDFDARIGTFTSVEAKRPELLYNQRCGYDTKSDTWWRLEGDFRMILIGNLMLSFTCSTLLLLLGSLGPG